MTGIIPLNQPETRASLIHGTCILLGPRALLLRGASGSGKSRLAGALLHDAATAGRFARLVADDQVEVRAVNGRLLVAAPAKIAGLREHAGIGVYQEPHQKSAVAGLVVDLIANDRQSGRVPEDDELVARIATVPLARLILRAGAPGTVAPGAVATIFRAMTLLSQYRYREDTLSTMRVESLLHRTPQIFNDRSCG